MRYNFYDLRHISRGGRGAGQKGKSNLCFSKQRDTDLLGDIFKDMQNYAIAGLFDPVLLALSFDSERMFTYRMFISED